jgi:hypothetical protein
MLAFDQIVVREYLPVEPLYYCREYSGMPVVKEFRAFISNNKVRYFVPYWPKKALREGNPSREDWEEMYFVDHYPKDSELPYIKRTLEKVAAVMPGEWSVDILNTKDGYYVTDCAQAAESYGYDPELMKLDFQFVDYQQTESN